VRLPFFWLSILRSRPQGSRWRRTSWRLCASEPAQPLTPVTVEEAIGEYLAGSPEAVAALAGFDIADLVDISALETEEPEMFANGFGAVTALAHRHLEPIRSQLAMTPRKPLDDGKFLAAANRRVAAKNNTVSPFCHVSFLNSDDRYSADAQAFVESGEHVPFAMPTLLFGIDLDGLAREFHSPRRGSSRHPERRGYEPAPPQTSKETHSGGWAEVTTTSPPATGAAHRQRPPSSMRRPLATPGEPRCPT
jgi:hypothetical protein